MRIKYCISWNRQYNFYLHYKMVENSIFILWPGHSWSMVPRDMHPYSGVNDELPQVCWRAGGEQVGDRQREKMILTIIFSVFCGVVNCSNSSLVGLPMLFGRMSRWCKRGRNCLHVLCLCCNLSASSVNSCYIQTGRQ